MNCQSFVLPACPAAEFLAFDEAMLELGEATGSEWLWFWESAEPWVVVGLGQSVAREVNEVACAEAGVPIYRRCSGGGTVVQGPGCLNYALVLQIERATELESVTGTNRWIMERQRAALALLTSEPIEVQGHTDLALRTAGGLRKFSGNAQRRRRQCLLFHGTILLDFELRLAESLLRHPSAEPDYRAARPHGEFIANTSFQRAEVIAALENSWSAVRCSGDLPWGRVRELAASRYDRKEWNYRR